MAKKIVLMTTGTRGDIQPFVALAFALSDAGYDVRLGVPANYLEAPESARVGLTAVPFEVVRCGEDFRALMEDPKVKEILSGGTWTKLRYSREVSDKWLGRTVEDMARMGEGADAILFHPKLSFAIDVAEANGAEPFLCAFQPLTPTREFPFFLFPWGSLGSWLNWKSHALINLTRPMLGKSFNRWRKKFWGLPPLSRFSRTYSYKGKDVPALYGFSSALVPKPADWPEDHHVTGYWWKRSSSTPSLDPDLMSFIQEGASPIYIGFGSMPIDEPEEKAKMLVEAVKQAGVRAVIAKGWGGLDPSSSSALPDCVYLLDSAPHDALFPLMAGIVHHGGSGTTHASLRARRPTLVCPFLVDQPFWGRRVALLGAGPQPLPPKAWTVDKLSDAFKALVDNEDFKKNASRAGEKIRAEDGVQRAVSIIRAEIGM